MAALVIADAADQRHFVSQLVGVGGKVERSAAQILGLADDVPQDLPNADDAHAAVLQLHRIVQSEKAALLHQACFRNRKSRNVFPQGLKPMIWEQLSAR